MAKIKLQGDKAVIRALTRLPQVVFQDVLPRASGAAMGSLIPKLKESIRSTSSGIGPLQSKGKLQRPTKELLAISLGAIQKKYRGRRKGSGTISTIVGPQEKYNRKGTTITVQALASILEWGAVAHDRPKRGPHPGAKPQPWMRPVWDAENPKVKGKFIKRLRRDIQKAVNKLKGKQLRRFTGDG